MNFKRKLFFISCFFIIDILLLVGIVFLRSLTIQNILDNEDNYLTSFKFLKDKYSDDNKNSGNYSIIEKVINNYLSDYSSSSQFVFDDYYLGDNLFAVDNYICDGTDFNEYFAYIEKMREEFNEKIDILIKSTENNEVNNFIYNSLNNDNELINLYHNLLFDDRLFDELEDINLSVEKRRIEVNSYYNSVNNVLLFLNYNKEHYKIENGQIVFDDIELKTEYDNLFSKTKRIY